MLGRREWTWFGRPPRGGGEGFRDVRRETEGTSTDEVEGVRVIKVRGRGHTDWMKDEKGVHRRVTERVWTPARRESAREKGRRSTRETPEQEGWGKDLVSKGTGTPSVIVSGIHPRD